MSRYPLRVWYTGHSHHVRYVRTLWPWHRDFWRLSWWRV